VQKGFKNAFRSCPNSPKNFRDFSGNYSHFSLSYLYLLEGSKIFFMSSKCFIWIVHVLIYSRNFPGIFGIFFVAFMNYLAISRLFFSRK
jgi:hypothetical protein